ncbi:MAG: hydrolase [Runella slithyformis]|nr:MAG: hydrolase [Runella slithyformis]TAF25323.1 MAG: hydrolase [Runella slithyformis]TAF43667.1 MAG: hydrolase [Runella slithyformis]TAF78993.1 MAG: hydrolase [Runella slithyformis]TAH10181.1 MAG: hydrolase [Runella slithyformis]
MRLLFLLFLPIWAISQTPHQVKFTTEKIKIDGVLDEAVWQNTPTVGEFWEYFPSDTVKAKLRTEVRITYDDKNIYVSSKCYAISKKFVILSYRRDYRAGGNDNISFIFDTFNDKTNAFLFGMNPLGVMREALLFNGATDGAFFSEFWDNKWTGNAQIYDDHWTTEMAIPFTTLRFKEGTKQWFFKSYRFDTQLNEQSSLIQIPQNQIIMNLGYSIPIEFEKPLKKPGANISIIPYLAAGSSQDFVNPKNPNNGTRLTYGADAKIAVTSGLNLDLTVNPDFSNVEADRQIINLTRFDVNFPEQRQFFLENSDLFSGFGSYLINPFLPQQGNVPAVGNQIISPFFSRQIGIAKDSTTGVGVQNRILYGARLSGKIDDNWRIGLLNAQTADDEFKGISGANFTVASVQRKVFSRSNIAAIFINKQTLRPELGRNLASFNRVGGLEYNLASADNRWQGKLYHHQSFSQNQQKDAFVNGFSMMYSVLKYTFRWAHDWVGKGYDAEVGFVPRRDFLRINPTIGFSFYPRTKLVNRYSVGVALEQYNMPNIGVTDRTVGPFLSVSFQSSARMLFTINQNYTYLFSDFDALRSNNRLPVLRKGNGYTYYSASLNYFTDQRKKLWLFAQPLVGQYYNGNIVSLVGSLNYRGQPYINLAMNFTYNHINLPIGQNDVFLIGPRLDWTFSKSVFWTTFLQYNSQFENMNVNTRLQWRFAPVSDFFLVYTDNYDTFNGNSRNRSIQAKLTYWFNL